MAMLQKETGFAANKAQYKSQISRWQFRKNETRKEVEGQDEKYEPTDEQRRQWASRGEALLTIYDLGYEQSLQRLALISLVRFPSRVTILF